MGWMEQGAGVVLGLLGLTSLVAWLPTLAWPWPISFIVRTLGTRLVVCMLQTQPQLAQLTREERLAVAEWFLTAQVDDPLLILRWDPTRVAQLTLAWGTPAQAAVTAGLLASGARAHQRAPDTIFFFASEDDMLDAHENVLWGNAGLGIPSRSTAFSINSLMSVDLNVPTRPAIASSIMIHRVSLGQVIVDRQFFDYALSRR